MLPDVVAQTMRGHLSTFVQPGPESLVFGTRNGTLLAPRNFRAMLLRALDRSGMPKMRVHELRHSALQFADDVGATEKERMSRGGHSSAPASNRYTHAVKARDAAIASKINSLILDVAPDDVH